MTSDCNVSSGAQEEWYSTGAKVCKSSRASKLSYSNSCFALKHMVHPPESTPRSLKHSTEHHLSM